MFIFMRLLLVISASLGGYFVTQQILGSKLAYIGFVSGLLIAVSAILFEERVKRTPLRIVAGGAAGLITGLVVANLLTYPIIAHFQVNGYVELAASLIANSVIGYLGLSVGMKKGDELESFDIAGLIAREIKDPGGQNAGIIDKNARARTLIIDTSVIIDGRIAEVTETGFLEGAITVPQFVLQELQYIADSADPVKRVRGKRGLDVLKQIQTSKHVTVNITERDFPSIKEVDAKLVALAKETGGKILTNDSNLNKIAELQKVGVLNINKLATALKPVVLPGEVMNILVQKEGKEHGQGVGYLDDGTMVVIDNARDHLGKSVDVSITSVLQTTGGRMIFSKVKEDYAKRPVYQ